MGLPIAIPQKALVKFACGMPGKLGFEVNASWAFDSRKF
jgi:hypothetical protein